MDIEYTIRVLQGSTPPDFDPEPETRWPLPWLLYGWPAFTALILGASIALAVWLG